MLSVHSISETFGQSCSVTSNKCTFKKFKLEGKGVLPECSGCNSSQTEVTFTYSELHSFPSEIFEYFPSVVDVRMRNQKIQELKDGSFLKAAQLKYLDIDSNAMESLMNNSFLGAENLEKLSLRDNLLHDIKYGAFMGLSKLQSLFISDNQIEFLPETVFDPLTSLRYLYLFNNSLTLLVGTIFQKNSNLKEIYLYKNKLNTISRNTFSNLPAIQRLDLDGNECVSYNWLVIEDFEVVQKQLEPCYKSYDQFSIDYEEPLEITTLEPKIEENPEVNGQDLMKEIKKFNEKIENLSNSVEIILKTLEKVSSRQDDLETYPVEYKKYIRSVMDEVANSLQKLN